METSDETKLAGRHRNPDDRTALRPSLCYVSLANPSGQRARMQALKVVDLHGAHVADASEAARPPAIVV